MVLARVIAGEAVGCPMEAKLAVAHTWQNRIEAGIEGGWFGDRMPTDMDIFIAENYRVWPDPTDGAMYMISPADRAKMPWLSDAKAIMTGEWVCRDGRKLQSWRMRRKGE